MIYLSNEPYPQEISVPRSFGVIVPQRNTYLSTVDIAADLETDSDTKVLAASQGVTLKAMVDAKADADDVYTKQEVDTALAGKQDELVAGENITIEGNVISATGGGGGGDSYTRAETDALLAEKADKSDTYTKQQVDTALAGKADVTDIPTKTSDLQNNSGFVTGQEVSQTYETKSDATAKETALQTAINTKQDTLESGVNIKTINNQSLLGSGNIDIPGGSGTIDNEVTKDSANAVKSSGIYAALGKYGVISQTLNFTGNLSTGYTPSAPTNVQYGLIPQLFIDMVLSTNGGASFNESTGYFELKGLMNISYEEMRYIYEFGEVFSRARNAGSIYWDEATSKPLRTLLANTKENGNMAWSTGVNLGISGSRYLEVIDLSPYPSLAARKAAILNVADLGGSNHFSHMRVLKGLNLSKLSGAITINACSLEDMEVISLKSNLTISNSSRLSAASVAYTINNISGSAAITITLHATAYARAIADADVQAALAAHTNVTLASN